MSTYPNGPGQRKVETSVAAADDLAPQLGPLQARAHSAIQDAGADGFTAVELAAQRLKVDRLTIQPAETLLSGWPYDA